MRARNRRLTAVTLASAVALLVGCGFDNASPLPEGTPAPNEDEPPTSPAPEPRCEDKSAQPTEAVWTLSSAGLEREFRVRVPSNYDPTTPLPLILNFHGYGSYAAQQQWLSGLAERVDARQFVAVHAEGTGLSRGWNAGACCGSAAQSQIDDVQFVTDMLDELEAELCIDSRRVYATGLSNGGFLSHRLACELSDRFAAIAPVAGVIGIEDCDIHRAVPVMHFHGTLDAIVPLDGNPTLNMPSVRETMTGWALRDGCSDDVVSTFAEGDSTCFGYQGCAEGSEVITCIVEGGGHTWPGGQPLPMFGKTSKDLVATEQMLDFFANHALPQ